MFCPYPKMKDSGVEWLGGVPEHWEVRKLGTLGMFFKGRGISKADITETGVPAITYGDLYTRYGVEVKALSKYISPEVAASAQEILRGDLLFAASGETIEEIGKTTLYSGDVPGYAGGDVIVLRIEEGNGLFISYALNSDLGVRQRSALGRGDIIVHISATNLKQIVIPIPPKDEGIEVARFLHRKTALIDDLITKRERQIELLQEQRTALISRAVTKGLNPDAPMKDSGVERLGEIPTHWEVKNNRALFQERIEFGIQELPVLKVSLHSGVTEGENDDDDSSRVRKMMDDKTSYKRAYAGDIAYNMMRAWQGAIGAVPVDGLVSPAYVVAKPAEGVESRYFEGLFRTSWYTKDFERYSYGVASFRWRLYWDQFKVLRSPVPPLNEQRAIADYIDREANKIDTFVTKIQLSVEKLREFRQSLVSAAVTGKIDVRGHAASATSLGVPA